MNQKDRTKLIKKMDSEFSKFVRSVGECEHCGNKDTLQCSHVISRKYYHTRWDPENAIALCYKCHIHWNHKEPHEFVRWFDKKFGGELYEELKRRSESTAKLDLEEIYAYLKTLNKGV